MNRTNEHVLIFRDLPCMLGKNLPLHFGKMQQHPEDTFVAVSRKVNCIMLIDHSLYGAHAIAYHRRKNPGIVRLEMKAVLSRYRRIVIQKGHACSILVFWTRRIFV